LLQKTGVKGPHVGAARGGLSSLFLLVLSNRCYKAAARLNSYFRFRAADSAARVQLRRHQLRVVQRRCIIVDGVPVEASAFISSYNLMILRVVLKCKCSGFIR